MSYIFIDNEDEAIVLCKNIEEYKGAIGADIETTGLDWMLDKILLLQLNIGEELYLLDIRELGYDVLTCIIKALNSSDKVIIFHNAKFDLKFIFYRTKIMIRHIFDTMIAEATMHNGGGKTHFDSLATLTEKYTNYFMDKETRKDFINFPDDQPYTTAMLIYSALDVKVLPEIMEAQIEHAKKTFQDKVVQLECDVIPVAAKMECDGIRLNAEQWLETEQKATARRDELSNELKNTIIDFALSLTVENGLKLSEILKIPVTGKARRQTLEDITDISLMRGWLYENFNPKSSHQMKAALNLMGIPVADTNEKTIVNYKDKPIIALLLSIREVNKQIDSYGRNVIQLIHPVTGKIHTEYKTVGTQTGRFSSRKPNMQQVPRSGGYRECFYPDDGFVFAAVDYSQQEYRLAGAVSRDRRIIDAYKHGSDMHTATAQVLYGKDKVTKEERNRGKTVNFAVLYGSTEYGLKYNLDISMNEAVKIINDFWSGYPSLAKFMDFAGKKILELGYSCTPMGRRRYNETKPVYGDSGVITKWRNKVLREGRNFIIQGGGADMLKVAMVEIYDRNPFGDKFRLCLQIHDELVAQVHESVKDEGLKFMMDIMEEVESRFLGEIPSLAEGELKERWSK